MKYCSLGLSLIGNKFRQSSFTIKMSISSNNLKNFENSLKKLGNNQKII